MGQKKTDDKKTEESFPLNRLRWPDEGHRMK